MGAGANMWQVLRDREREELDALRRREDEVVFNVQRGGGATASPDRLRHLSYACLPMLLAKCASVLPVPVETLVVLARNRVRDAAVHLSTLGLGVPAVLRATHAPRMLAHFLTDSYTRTHAVACSSALRRLPDHVIERILSHLDRGEEAGVRVRAFLESASPLMIAKNVIGAAAETALLHGLDVERPHKPRRARSGRIVLGVRNTRARGAKRLLSVEFERVSVVVPAPPCFSAHDTSGAERFFRESGYGAVFDAALAAGTPALRLCSGDSARVLKYRFFDPSAAFEGVYFAWRGGSLRMSLEQARSGGIEDWVYEMFAISKPSRVEARSVFPERRMRLFVCSTTRPEFVIHKLRQFLYNCTSRTIGEEARRSITFESFI